MNIKQTKALLIQANRFDSLPEVKKKLINELEKFENEYKGKLVVADLFQLGRTAGGFSLDAFNPAKPHRSNCLVECEFFVSTNYQSMESGKHFILDKEKTEERTKEHEAWMVIQREKDAVEAEVGESVASALKELGKTAMKGKGRK